jgi:hypothetical protein
MNVKTILWTVAGLLVGAGAGFAYYYFVGCASGSCPLTSNPLMSTLYGSAIGGLAFHGLGKKTSVRQK